MSSHQCPGPKCGREIPFELLACSAHWYQVPRPLRAAVWRAWDGGNGAGTPAHNRTIRLAIATMRPLANRRPHR